MATGRAGSGASNTAQRSFGRADRAVHQERNRMMARTKRDRRSYSAGEWGRNRVRVFADPKTGLYQIEWRENGRRLTRSLKHRMWTPPGWASLISEPSRWQSGQVLSYVRPLDAAYVGRGPVWCS